MGATMQARTGEQLRASRRRRMADDIELVGLRLFAEHGVDAVTVDDIADAADISRRTFFRYFASKDEVLHGSPERHLAIVLTALDAAPSAATPRALVREVLLALTVDFDERREITLLRKRIAAKAPDAVAHGHSKHTALADAVVDAVATHMGVDPETDLRPRVYVQAGIAAMGAALRLWFATDGEGSLQALAGEALDLIELR